MRIVVDDLTGAETIALVAAHLEGMHAVSPAESVHALDLDALRGPGITFWSAWEEDQIAGIGALARLDDAHGEIKSMRVPEAFLGRGVGRAILRHILDAARSRGLRRVSLETGSTAEFVAARRLYESEGFELCPPFGKYVEDPFSVFYTRRL